ncbi:uncharacterized protein LOC141886524 [Acropora palmata]|uniref:uncharacterized protein LOC141886524 n=1 Tax=Acropora palmata TaxID=6131 RepID=UPI003DA14C61
MATPSVEREQTDQETPRTVPETQQELVRRLLGEVSEMRKENQKLQSEVATLKANVTKRRLFRQPKEDNDPECSNAVRKVYQEFKKDQQENEENQQVFDLSASFDSPGDPGDTTEEWSRGPKPRKIRKLSWERSKLKNIKEILDESYSSGLNAKQRRTSARVSRCEEVSPRPCPVGGPSWAVRTRTQ